MEDIVFEGWDSENKRLVMVTDQGTVIHIKDCVCDQEPEPEPVPEPDPEAYDLEWDAYMDLDGSLSKINERFEVLEGRYENGIITFHFKSLADKLSMQGGVLLLDPINLGITPDYSLSGTGTIKSPRKPEFPECNTVAKWDGAVGLFFTVDGGTVKGSATTSEGDHPWNLHYGIEITGSIPV